MSKLALFLVLSCVSISSFAQRLSVDGFNNRFTLVKDAQGKVTLIKLKRAVTRFTIMPFIEQIKNDLIGEQNAFLAKNDAEKEAEIDEMLAEMGIDVYAKGADGQEEARRFKESILNIKNVNIQDAFAKMDAKDFWKEFETRLNEAFLMIDPTVVANLGDARFFYKRAVTYKVVTWALEQAKKKFANIPVLNIASYVIVRVHDMMLEQRHFNHNMLLHYFENVKETDLGMTKEEVDRAVSSIYEYRIEATDIFSSNRAAGDWLNFGMNNFYRVVRAGNSQIDNWKSGVPGPSFQNVKKINFAFAEVTEGGSRKIYHLHNKAHMFSSRPALAFDYGNPKKVKTIRSLLNLGGVALGFLNIPGWLKSNVQRFIDSMYVQQVRMEGALTGHFESTGNTQMLNSIFAQRANFYILK